MIYYLQINVREYRRGRYMDNPEKPATPVRQNEKKQSHNTLCVGHHHTLIKTNYANKT
jgi:hypothetical protein